MAPTTNVLNWIRPLIPVLFVALSPVATAAQDFNRTQFVVERVEAVRVYFESRPDSEFSLAAAQRLLVATGADLEADGAWGPATAAAFAACIDTMSRIGIADLQSSDPYVVAESIVTWNTALIEAQTGFGDYPD